MLDLEIFSGLPVAIDGQNKLIFNSPLPEVRPSVRTSEEMKSVLMDPAAVTVPTEVYYMYRNVHLPEHEQIIKDMNVSYDITVIPPGKIGQEFIKTAGHYHATKPGTEFAYPEAYEVITGKALFLLQKMDPLFQDVITIIGIEAQAGDKVVYPPNYGHIIINIGDEVLVTSNWVGEGFERMYSQVSDRHGLAYYAVADETGSYKFVKNENYGKAPEVRMITTKFMDRFELMRKDPMYTTGTTNPKALEFLVHPDRYAVELSSITS